MTAVALESQESCFRECWTNTGWPRCSRLSGLCGHAHQTNCSSELFLSGETLIQTQLGTTAAENHQDTSIDLCSCNYDPFPREIGHQQMLISQQLLYRDSLEFPSEREEAITRPPRARHNPLIKNRVNRVPELAEDPDTHKQFATHARESMNFSSVSTPIRDRDDSVYLLRVDNLRNYLQLLHVAVHSDLRGDDDEHDTTWMYAASDTAAWMSLENDSINTTCTQPCSITSTQ